MVAVEDQKSPQVVPHVKARRTLLIGLGTTGARICSQIMERLTWNYDSLENVPWVRCVVLETADLPEEMHNLRQFARFVHLKIEKQQYASLIGKPQDYEAQIGFSSWNIPELTRNQDAITDGANNTRILGRLALLFPANFDAIQREIKAALSTLSALDEKKAGEAFSRANREPVFIDLDNDIHVYVAGTLCGGTSSGGFIDLGYMLQGLEGYDHRLMTTGLFLLPSTAHANKKQTANAYAALVELNHFSSDNSRYRQQFPDRREPRQMPAGTRPYQYLYLLQARGEAEIEYAKLVTATADYIHSDVIGGTADTRDATRTNIADYFMHKDNWGATQKFFTFGIGTLEFPYTKVAKACSLRLTRVALQELSGGATLTQAELGTKLAETPLLRMDALMLRLLQRPGARLDSALEKLLQDAQREAMHSNDAIDLARAQAEAALQGNVKSDTHPDLPANVVPQTIEQNERQVIEEFRQGIVKAAQSFFGAGEPHGLTSLTSYLEGLKAALEAGCKESRAAQQNPGLSSYLSAADEAQERARQCRSDIPLLLMMGRSSAVHRYVRECLQNCVSYYTLRLREACAPVCLRIFEDNLALVERLLIRIGNPDCGLAHELHSIVDKLQMLYSTTNVAYGARYDGSVRVINGVELFDPATTVETEYNACLRTTAQEHKINGNLQQVEKTLAFEAIQKYIAAALSSLFAEVHAVRRFDPEGGKPTPDMDDNQLLELAHPAIPAFNPLKQISILSRLLDRPELAADLKKANEASGLLLDVNISDPRHQEAVNKHYKFVFCNDTDVRASEFRAALERAGVLEGQGGIRFMNDPHQIMIIHERGAFSLGTIRDLKEDMSAWQGDYSDPTIASFHSRKDVARWITWAKSDEESRAYLRNVFLVAIAVKVIEQSSAQQYVFTYPRKRPSDTGKLLLSNDLDLACQAIQAAGVEADIQSGIAAYRQSNGVADLFARISDFIAASKDKFLEADRRLSTEEIETYLFDYIREDVELFERFKVKFPNTAELALLGTDKDGKEVFLCACDRRELLGRKASDLYVEEKVGGRMVREFKCAYCRKNLNEVLRNRSQA